MEFTFEQLPKAITQLFDKVENIEKLLLRKESITHPDVDRLLNIQEAAKILSLSVPTIYGLVSKSEIPVSKKGKRLYFSNKELNDWVKSGRKKTNTEITTEANKYINIKAK